MTMNRYFRPLVSMDVVRPDDAIALADGWTWANRFEVLSRSKAPKIIAASELPEDVKDRLQSPRSEVCGLSSDQPRVMGIVNTTPDSFSDGGLYAAKSAAIDGAISMVNAGVDILDIGGESTRPGAVEVDVKAEIARTAPVIAGLSGTQTPISIDTRKSLVARAAFDAGATLLNDVSGFDFDPDMAAFCANASAYVCLMHAQGTPENMQDDPNYTDVLLDVYDALEARIKRAEAAGIPRARILVDPGIGFGKTLDHNLALLRGLSIFHGLGCALLIGVSRKRFIGTVAKVENATERMPGSLAVALAAVAQGAQVLRVHDVPETIQALRLWRAVTQ